jgi:hypothetical protein
VKNTVAPTSKHVITGILLRTKEQLCDYLHRAAGHPVKKTWLAAIKAGEYATWSGLTSELVSNHLYDTEETAMGHLHKRRQNIRSTKIKSKPIQNAIDDLEPELQGQFFIKKDRTERVGARGTPSRNGRSQWYDIYRPNRKISNQVIKRKIIYYGTGPSSVHTWIKF